MRFLLLFTLFSLAVHAQQHSYPQDYFRSPMDLPLHLSGTFGELRNNHFHSGLDIRTKQKTGFPVYAAAQGYVSRIKVSAYGYGTALYITHPNGYTTVYGHLQEYAPKIEEYVRAKQYEKQTFDIELMPKEGELVVDKGEVVALSGNSGGSGGPHLHFEIRDTQTEKIINPLFFGFDKKVKDTKAPSIFRLMVYPLSDDTSINESRNKQLVNIAKQKDGTFLAEKIKAKGKIGFAINASDKSTGSFGNNGIYKIEMFINGSPGFVYTFETFAFSESNAINNFIDYQHYYLTGERYQKLFVKTPYQLSIVNNKPFNGVYEIEEGKTINYRIEVSDFHGNMSVVHGSIEYSPQPARVMEPKRITNYFVKVDNDHNYTKNKVSVFIPANAFYEDFYMDFDVKDSTLILHPEDIAVQNPVTVSFDVAHLPAETLQKTFIAGINGDRKRYNSSYMEEGMLTAKVKYMGDFKLEQDNTPPKIYNPDFAEGQWLSAKDTFNVKISDDLSGIATFDAWLNGKWILMHYDYKTRVIYHNFNDGIVDEGRNDLKIVVTDNVGNSATFETHFFRTQNKASVENNK